MTPSRIAFAVFAVACSIALVAIAQPPAPKQSQSEMKKKFSEMVDKSTAPTDQHKLLAPFVGSFDQASEVRMGPGDPMKTHALAKGRWIMGDRFVKVDCTSAPDEELKGDRLLIYGYDPQARKFTLLNLESMSLTALFLQGDYDAATKTFTFDGERDQPGAGKVPVRWVIKVQEGGMLAQEILMKQPGGQEFAPVVTIKYTPKRK